MGMATAKLGGRPFRRRDIRHFGVIFVTALAISLPGGALGGAREQARRLHDRIAGVPPSAAVLADMESRIGAGDSLGAAWLAMDNDAFYDVTLKNFAAPWTNRERSVFVDLNDYIATVVGMVRDEVPFNQLLSADLLYVGNPSLGLPPYSTGSNAHYLALEAQGLPLKDSLVAVAQSSVTGIPADATAGVMTTRAAAKAFFIAGTNRAMFRFTLLNHLCKDLEQLQDTSRAPDRIRQDVSRSPGGDSRIFLNNCVGCHAGMDPMAQAFAYYDYEYDPVNDPDAASGRLVYNGVGSVDPATGSRVQGKYLINPDNFKYGYITPDDRWDNYWRAGPNSLLGWSASLPGAGNGAKSLGAELAGSEAFARCQVEKAFQAMCLRPPSNAADRAQVDATVVSFKASNYNLKRAFAESAVYCMGN